MTYQCRTYDLAEPRLEVVDSDIVLDLLELDGQGSLRLHQSGELCLGDLRQLADSAKVLVLDNDDGLLDNRLLDDQRVTLLRLRPVLQAPSGWRNISLNRGRHCNEV